MLDFHHKSLWTVLKKAKLFVTINIHIMVLPRQAQDDIRAQVVTSDNETLGCDFSLVYRNQAMMMMMLMRIKPLND